MGSVGLLVVILVLVLGQIFFKKSANKLNTKADLTTIAELKAANLTDVKTNDSLLEDQYFMRLDMFIQKRLGELIKQEKEAIADLRRESYKRNDFDAYESYVQ